MRAQLKNTTAYDFKLNKMNSDTYAMRRKVMDIIYEVKNKGYNIPRIEVRIVKDGDVNACGYAYLSENIVHINERYIDDVRLREIVLHEIVHAVTGFEHDNSCYLMCESIPLIQDDEQMWKCFDKYMK
jgi:hypothetical protein